MLGRFNCITVNFDKTQHSINIYTILNFIISIHAFHYTNHFLEILFLIANKLLCQRQLSRNISPFIRSPFTVPSLSFNLADLNWPKQQSTSIRYLWANAWKAKHLQVDLGEVITLSIILILEEKTIYPLYLFHTLSLFLSSLYSLNLNPIIFFLCCFVRWGANNPYRLNYHSI